MIEISEVGKIHDILIERFGGGKGIRDRGILESAIRRPFQTFDGKDLYPDPLTKLQQFLKVSFQIIHLWTVIIHKDPDGNELFARLEYLQ